MVVETKRPGGVNSESQWTASEEQLFGYQSQILANRDEGEAEQVGEMAGLVYGIIAAGRAARFYCYEKGDGQAKGMEPGQERVLHVTEDEKLICSKLTHMKRRH